MLQNSTKRGTCCILLQAVESYRMIPSGSAWEKLGKTWLWKAGGLGNAVRQNLGQVNREVEAQEVPTGRREWGGSSWSQAWIKFHFPSEEFPENPSLLLLWMFTSCRASGGSSLWWDGRRAGGPRCSLQTPLWSWLFPVWALVFQEEKAEIFISMSGKGEENGIYWKWYLLKHSTFPWDQGDLGRAECPQKFRKLKRIPVLEFLGLNSTA